MTQRFIGIVVGTATSKTAKVAVERLKQHRIFPLAQKMKRNFIIHDPEERCVIGDLVSIVSPPPGSKKLSKTKNFVLDSIIKEARRYRNPKTGQIYTAPAVESVIPKTNKFEYLRMVHEESILKDG